MAENLKIGIIGFDTSHVPAFTKLLNDPSDPNHVPGATVVAGVATFSADLEASRSRVEGFTQQMRDEFKIDIKDSIDELLEGVDAVLLESVDGRRHLAEATPVLKAGKPVFIDKPLAADFLEAEAIVKLAAVHNCPIFSSSSMRYDANILELKADSAIGQVRGCNAFSPANLDPTNPGYFWYGIHGVEILYTFMGPGCESVSTQHTDGGDVTTGVWADGRLGTMRGLRKSAGDYGVTVFGSDKVGQTVYSRTVPMYAQLLKQVVPFLGGAPAPVAIDETLEIMKFMQAALLSERQGRTVKLAEVQSAN